MDIISANEHQLLSFFASEPHRQNPAIEWQYDDATYTVAQNGVTLSMAIHPRHRDVHIILSANEQRVYELNAMDVADVVYSKDGEQENLLIMLRKDQILLLQVRPAILILQH